MVAPIVAEPAWVIDGSYRGKLGDLVLNRAELVIWLDLPRRVWVPRLGWRTIRRIVRREELWNGNRETVRNVLIGRDSLFRFAWRTYPERRRRYPSELARFPTTRLSTTAEVRSFQLLPEGRDVMGGRLTCAIVAVRSRRPQPRDRRGRARRAGDDRHLGRSRRRRARSRADHGQGDREGLLVHALAAFGAEGCNGSLRRSQRGRRPSTTS